jgi:hypothetical protein
MRGIQRGTLCKRISVSDYGEASIQPNRLYKCLMVRSVSFEHDECGWVYNHNGPMEVAPLAREDPMGDASKGGYRGAEMQLAPQSQSSVEVFQLRRKSTTDAIFYESSVNVSSASTPSAHCIATAWRQFVLDRSA